MTRRPHDEMKQDIAALAARVVSAEGVGGLSARGLAGAAGISVGTLYNLFGDLDGVVREVNLGAMAALEEALRGALAGAGEDREARLTALAVAYSAFARADPNRWGALFRLRPERSPDPRVAVAEGRLLGLLREAAGPLPEEALRALWAAVHGVVELGTRRHLEGAEAPDYARLVVSAGLRGIAALEAEGRL